MEHVFHTRQHFKLTCKMLFPKLHPLIGHCRQFHHRQQQGHGTPDCRPICITSWPCPKMCRSATDAVTVLQTPHNIVVKQVDRRVVRRDDNTGTLVYTGCTAQTLPIPITSPSPAHIMRKNLFLTDMYISTSAPTTHLIKARRKC